LKNRSIRLIKWGNPRLENLQIEEGFKNRVIRRSFEVKGSDWKKHKIYYYDENEMESFHYKVPYGQGNPKRKGPFISVGTTRGKKLFVRTLLTVKYFFDILDVELWKALLYGELYFEGDALKHPQHLREVYEAGRELASAI